MTGRAGWAGTRPIVPVGARHAVPLHPQPLPRRDAARQGTGELAGGVRSAATHHSG